MPTSTDGTPVARGSEQFGTSVSEKSERTEPPVARGREPRLSLEDTQPMRGAGS